METATTPAGTWRARLAVDRAAMLALADRVRDSILPHLGKGPIVYADIPVHLNIGDLLINKGVEALLDRHGIPVRSRIAMGNARRLFADRHAGDHVIALHGGGNFGDLYPDHEQFRQRVLESFPDTPVVLLPQTVHYRDRERLAHDMAAWARHRKLVFMARDRRSHALVAPFLGERALCVPDTAHCLLDRLAPFAPPRDGEDGTVLRMGRRDIERHPDAAPEPAAGAEFDWDDLRSPLDRVYYKAGVRLFEADGRAPLPLDPAKVWYRFRDRMVAKAVHRYVESDSVETDRLHGMLLALLLGKPVRVRDNGYGKLGSYLETWLPTEAGTADAPASRRAI